MFKIESAGITDVGQKRPHNEDALLLDDQLRLFVVADGMGGHQAGEVASALVIETLQKEMRGFETKASEGPFQNDETLSPGANRLLAAIYKANSEVYALAQRKTQCRGMGATLAAVLATEETLIAANVGDSPIFLIHAGAIERLSVVHNVITEQTAMDPNAGQRIAPKYQRMLTRAMGIAETVQPDLCEIQLFAGDSVVLGSDGLSDKMSPEEILATVERHAPTSACQELVDLANRRGGEDNITVIVLKFTSSAANGHGFIGLMRRLWKPLKSMFN